MKIAILGGSGFIGRHLCQHLLQQGHDVQIWTRAPEELEIPDVKGVKWPLDEAKKHLDVEAIVNLAGETINQRWTPEAKHRIMQSRVDTTYHIIELVKKRRIAPKVIVNGSAIGYYGFSRSKTFTENAPPQNDFLSQVSSSWERASEQFTMLGIRLVKMRFGLVLGKDGGALLRMMLPFNLYAGGNIGSGEQWVSWVHIDDVVRMIVSGIEEEDMEGAYNCTAPHPVQMKEFTKVLARVMQRPHWLPVPSIALQAIFGEMADLILRGQKVIPARFQEKGYSFSYPRLEQALSEIISQKQGSGRTVSMEKAPLKNSDTGEHADHESRIGYDK